MIDMNDEKKDELSNMKLIWNKPVMQVISSDETWGGMGNSLEACGAWES